MKIIQGHHRRLRTRDGFLMLDALLGIAIFAIFVTAIVLSLLFSQLSNKAGGDRMRGIYFAETAMEAVRSIRDEDFDILVDGTYGVQIGSDGNWELTPDPVETIDHFRTQVEITALSDDQKSVVVATTWKGIASRSGSIVLEGELTNWHKIQEIGNWGVVSLLGSDIDAGTPLYNSIVVADDVAYVTSEVSDGGVGLYIFDVSSPSSPVRISSSFQLGVAGYQLAINGNRLVVLTGDPNEEIRLYDITSPTSFSAANLVASIDVPGSARARSLELSAGTVFVGALEHATYAELYAYEYSSDGDFNLLDSHHDVGNYFDMSLSDGYAYLATSMNSSELRVVDVFTPEDLSPAPGSGSNVTDVQDALSIATVSGLAFLGRANGEVIEELVAFDISESPVPPASPAPRFHEMGGSANAIDIEPGARYLFAASDFDEKELQIIDVNKFVIGQSAEASFYNTTTGAGRGITYDATNDLVYMVTNTALLVFAPGS